QAAGQVLLFDRTLDPEHVAAEVDAVTAGQLADLTQKILAPGKAAVAVLGPKASLAAADRLPAALFS
ncbi:MAG TPA: insulinase family protein, partial [Phenylobacterium sp.]|nr:insulinase family protein [Phenylobacterium sp.]